MDYITDLRDDDVLLGRGSGPNDHEGNIRFRLLVAERKAEYMATNHRLTKAKIAQEIVDRVHANGGRFLRKLENDELLRFDVPDGVDAWAVATEETIMEKAKQALRQNTNKARPGISDDPKSKLSPRRLSPKPPSSRSPVPRVGVSGGAHPAMSVPRLDDFEPIPLDQAYASNPTITAPMPSRIVDPAALNMNFVGPQQQQQHIPGSSSNYVEAQPQMPAPSRRAVAPHDAYLHALSQQSARAPQPAPVAAPSQTNRTDYARVPAMRTRPVEDDVLAPSVDPVPAMTSGPRRVDTLDLQDDSILAHLPAHVRAQFLQGAGAIASVDDSLAPVSASVGARSASNQSMDQIPLDDDDFFDSGNNEDVTDGGARSHSQYPRLASMDMTDLARYHSRRERFQASEDNMSVVMDSFSKLKASSNDGDQQQQQQQQKIRYYNRRWSNQTTESERNRMMTSTDTMGTIDPIGMGSMADMSFATMNSSTFSVYRGNETSASEMGSASPNDTIPSRVIVEPDPNLVVGNTGAAPPLKAAATTTSSSVTDEAPANYRQQPLPPSAVTAAAPGRFESSFSHTDLPVSRTAARYQNLMSSNNVPQHRQDAIREDYEEAYDGVGPAGTAAGAAMSNATMPSPASRMPNRLGEDDPTGGDLGIDGMGLSSMELLKSAFHSSTDWDISSPPPPPSQSQPLGQPPYDESRPPPPA